MKNKKSNKMPLAGKIAIAFGLGWSVFTGCKKAPEPKPEEPIASKVMEKAETIKKGFGTGTFQLYTSEKGYYDFTPMMRLAKEELKELFKNEAITVKLGPSYSTSFANADVLIKSYEDSNGYRLATPAVKFAEKHQKNVLEQGTVTTSVNGKAIETPLKYIDCVESNLTAKKIKITLNDHQYEFENYDILKQIKEDFWKEEEGASELEKGINELYEKEGYFERNNIKTPLKYIDISDIDAFVNDETLDDKTKEHKALTVYFNNKDSERTEFKFFDKEHLDSVMAEFKAEFKEEYTSLLNSEEGYIKTELNDEKVNVPLKYVKSRKNQTILNRCIKKDEAIGEYLTIQIGTESPIEFNLQITPNTKETYYEMWNNFKRKTKEFLNKNNVLINNGGIFIKNKEIGIKEYKKMYDCLNKIKNDNHKISNKPMIYFMDLEMLDEKKGTEYKDNIIAHFIKNY